MNKSELVARLADRLGGDRALATTAVNGVLEEIEGSVARGERVSLVGFGTFDRRERPARTGRNPQTGATLQLAPSVTPVFRAGAGFRSLLHPNGNSIATAAAAPRLAAVADDAPTKKAAKAAKKDSKKAGSKRAVALTGKAGKKAAKQAVDKKPGKAAKKGR